MDQCPAAMTVVHLVLGVLAAINVALGTWLAHKRRMADIREHKRNGDGLPSKRTIADKLYPSEAVSSSRDSSPKD